MVTNERIAKDADLVNLITMRQGHTTLGFLQRFFLMKWGQCVVEVGCGSSWDEMEDRRVMGLSGEYVVILKASSFFNDNKCSGHQGIQKDWHKTTVWKRERELYSPPNITLTHTTSIKVLSTLIYFLQQLHIQFQLYCHLSPSFGFRNGNSILAMKKSRKKTFVTSCNGEELSIIDSNSVGIFINAHLGPCHRACE